MALADVNGDGKPDIVVAIIGSNTVGVLLGNGNGTFQDQQAFATGVNPSSVALGDVNGDGKPDLVVTNYRQQHGGRAAGQRRRHVPGRNKPLPWMTRSQ